MKKIKLEWNVKSEKELQSLLTRLYVQTLKREITEKDISRVFKPLKRRVLELSKQTKVANKDILNKILSTSMETLTNTVDRFKSYQVLDNKKGLEGKALLLKRLGRVKISTRYLQEEIYLMFLKEIAKETDYYIWHTMGDDRVRETHQELDGELFKFSNSDILPQEEPNCRCYAEVVFPSSKREKQKLEKQVSKENVKTQFQY